MWSQCDMVLVLQRIFWSSLFVVVLLWITNISFHGSTSSCTFQKCALQYWQSVTLVAEGRLRTSEWWPWFGMFVGFDMDQVLMWHVVMSHLVLFAYICLTMTMTSWDWSMIISQVRTFAGISCHRVGWAGELYIVCKWKVFVTDWMTDSTSNSPR